MGIRCASLVAQTVKNLPAMQETRVRSLGQEDPLEKEMATHFSIFAWRIPWTEEPGDLQSMRSLRVGHNSATNIHTSDVQAHEGSRVQGRGEPEFGFWSSSPRSTSYYQ